MDCANWGLCKKERDGLIRAAVVKVASRERQHSILKRPIQLLYPLEIHYGSTVATPSQASLDPKSIEPSPAEDDVTEQVRPKRAASKKADEVRRQWIAELEKSDWVSIWTMTGNNYVLRLCNYDSHTTCYLICELYQYSNCLLFSFVPWVDYPWSMGGVYWNWSLFIVNRIHWLYHVTHTTCTDYWKVSCWLWEIWSDPAC